MLNAECFSVATDTDYVCTYYGPVDLTLSVDEKIVEKARKAAHNMGSSPNQVIRDFLEELAGGRSATEEIDEFERLSTRARVGQGVEVRSE